MTETRKSRLHAAATALAATLAMVSFVFNSDATAEVPKAMPTHQEAAPKTLVLIGASYAADWGTPKLPGYQVTNKGIGGQESTAVRARFDQDVVALKPDAVMIWGHYNDIVRAKADQREQAARRAQDNYVAMHQMALQAGIEPILVTEITMPIAEGWKETLAALYGRIRGKQNYRKTINQHIETVNQWQRDYARKNGVRLLDFEQALEGPNGSRDLAYAQPDGSHINPAGYAKLTQYCSVQLAR